MLIKNNKNLSTMVSEEINNLNLNNVNSIIKGITDTLLLPIISEAKNETDREEKEMAKHIINKYFVGKIISLVH